MAEEQTNFASVELPHQAEYGGWKMKRSHLLVAVSALLVAASATAAQAQVVISSPGAQVTVATPVPLTGTVFLQDTGARSIPSGVNETGRLARFIGDDRMMDMDVQFTNRDYQAWKPLEAKSKDKVRRYMRGSLRTAMHPIEDQKSYVGRLPRFMADDRIMGNNIVFENRDYEALKPVYAPSAKNLINSRIRGLAAGTNLTSSRRVAVRTIDPAQVMMWY